MHKVSFRKADVEGFNIFYREAGPTDAQTLLLLHGFPSASHIFRDLVPGLAANEIAAAIRDFPRPLTDLENCHARDRAGEIRRPRQPRFVYKP
jgi:pimeloyl-ACP methyl ester carboxylesterase